MGKTDSTKDLDLRAGEIVEIRSADEILRTLDEAGRLDAMPFMPEMLKYCGKRFRVHKKADKTCDNIKTTWSIRRVRNTVHLEGLRCDGSAHGNCEASCMIFWREAWLKRVDSDVVKISEIGDADSPPVGRHPAPSSSGTRCSLAALQHATQAEPASGSSLELIYSCQATELLKFTTDLPWWDLRQYYRDIRSGNLSRGIAIASSDRILEMLLAFLEVVRALLIQLFNGIQRIRSGVQYPSIQGSSVAALSVELNLQPGEFVQVRSREEILATLDRNNRNRGLFYDIEMLRFCGSTHRVLKRVNQIVDERTGKMRKMKAPCIILDGAYCMSEYHRFCPRAIYPYWRESWLKRVE